jgi:hypothetical protein
MLHPSTYLRSFIKYLYTKTENIFFTVKDELKTSDVDLSNFMFRRQQLVTSYEDQFWQKSKVLHFLDQSY